jgi:hypothetical protein
MWAGRPSKLATHRRRFLRRAAGRRGSGKVRRMSELSRLTGPVAGPPGIIMTGFDLGQAGYTLEEFFLESTATAFEPVGPVGADGYWEVAPAGQAPFTTRLVACRPSDPGAYTGTVILEWLNVSAGFDAPAHWMLTVGPGSGYPRSGPASRAAASSRTPGRTPTPGRGA